MASSAATHTRATSPMTAAVVAWRQLLVTKRTIAIDAMPPVQMTKNLFYARVAALALNHPSEAVGIVGVAAVTAAPASRRGAV